MESLEIEYNGRTFKHGTIDSNRIDAHEKSYELNIKLVASSEVSFEEIKKAFEEVIKKYSI